MKRQLRKVIFLPANEMVLYNTTFKKFRFRLTQIFKFLKKKYDYWPYIFFENVWWAIDDCKNLNFEFIIYPEIDSSLTAKKIEEAFLKLKEKKLVISLLEGNSEQHFLQAIDSLNINPHNSFLISSAEIANQVSKSYFPRNNYREGMLINKPLGLYQINWNGEDSLVNKITSYRDITRFIYTPICFEFLRNKILYLEEDFDHPINLFIEENLPWINKQAYELGIEFLYLPELLKNKTDDLQGVVEYICYLHPRTDGSDIKVQQIHEILSDSRSIYTYLFDLLNFPAIKTPALVRNVQFSFPEVDNEFSIFSLSSELSIKDQFIQYFGFIKESHGDGIVRYSFIEPSENPDADEMFHKDANKLTEEVIQKIDWLKKEGLNGMLAEIAYRLFNDTDNKFIKKGESGKQIIGLNEYAKSELSRLRIDWVSKYDFVIILPDYGNMIVEMPRLPKALYYFFLQHPEGVMLNSLADYKEELLSIYERISNKGDKEEIVRNINRLVDPLDNSVNVNCSRIKNAFVKLISDRLAKHYYITGWRGEPKKVNLLPEQIEIIHVF